MPRRPASRTARLAKATSIGFATRHDWRTAEASCRWRIPVQRCLVFIRRAKRLGFTLPEIAELLALSASKDDDMAALRDNVALKLADVQRRLTELRRVRDALRGLLDDCPGHGELRDCPILVALGGDDE